MKVVVGENVVPDFGNSFLIYVELNVPRKKFNSQFNRDCNYTNFIWDKIGISIDQFIHGRKT